MTRTAKAAAIGVAALALWLLAGPSALGGPVTYVSTYGTSMSPRVQPGDLVIARATREYRVGDAAVYRSEKLGGIVVFHRIVDVSPDARYTFKGDANGWLDPDQPTIDQISGREWLHIPGGGVWLQRIANPVNLAVAAFLLVIAAGATEAHKGRRRHRRRRMADDSGGKAIIRPWWATLAPSTRQLLIASAVTAVVGLLLAALAFTRPATVAASVAATGPDATMEFSYSAEAVPSEAYQDDVVRSPMPIFRSQISTVTVNYAYEGPSATISTLARLQADSGWTWEVALSEPETVEPPYTGAVTLDLDEIDRLATRGAEATGIPWGALTVTVVPVVQTDLGMWEPEYPLTLTAQTMKVGDDAQVIVTQASQPAPDGSATVAGEVSVLGFGLPVWLLRLASIALVLLGLAGVVYCLIAGKRQSPASEAQMIRLRYGSMIVPVSEPPRFTGKVVDVPDIDSLARLARRYVLLILMTRVNGLDIFVVQDEDVAYRYVSVTPPPYPAEGVQAVPQ